MPTLEEVKKFLEENKDNEQVKAFVGELSAVSADKVEGFLETEEGKRFIQPRLDSYFTKGLATWKANNLDSIVEEKIRERNPDKSPAELEIEKLKKQIEDAEKARNREALVNKALNVADEKKLPKGVIDYFIGEDEETTLANLSKFEETFNAAVQNAVDIKFKESGTNFEKGDPTPAGGAVDIGALANQANIRK
ncbi:MULTISPECIES: DUF4355 domain-containing protein [Bacillus]|uniref:DUF4355 domain-containing protein n=1 Tax=Bacillus subtilis TaxID=1423 RepID=A0A0D1KWZ5_BACIU|nr:MULTISPECIES: DUF4355 domain-containing protein [Bacillus subtilis group]KIU13225.1 hypothetical protein SC09_Contig17orf00414 [Bacillus subtilis]MEC3693638.1 DUF4355 domain-containing protein [Bacillus subtilis]MED4326711.1 DUF4355 domain-containing protein [Bacillus licheniformis]MED4342409.1 DUF4355 domain-containing protein [Bacillus licheniformis]NJI50574.1 DUF4355 domain-containing protein [Bacillus subtilis]